MEEVGFSIAVPETMLLGFGIVVVLAVIILVKVFKTAKYVEDIYYKVDDMDDRLKRLEHSVEKLSNKA